MYRMNRMWVAAAAGALAVSGGAYVATAQLGEPAGQVPAAEQPAAQATDLEEFEGRIVDVVRFVQGEDQPGQQPPAQFGAPPDRPGGGIGEGGLPAQPERQQPQQQRPQQPAPPPGGIGGAMGGAEGPVGLVQEEDGEEQLYVLAVNSGIGGPPQPGGVQPPPQRQAPAEPEQAPLPPQPGQQEPGQQGQPEQEAPQFDIPGGGIGQPGQPAQPAQPEQRQAAPAQPGQPGAGIGAPAGPQPVRTQADLEREIGEEVTLHGERHERAGVEVIVVERLEREDAPATGQPGQPAPMPGEAPAQEPEAPAEGEDMPWLQEDDAGQDAQTQGEAEDDGGFDFDW